MTAKAISYPSVKKKQVFFWICCVIAKFNRTIWGDCFRMTVVCLAVNPKVQHLNLKNNARRFNMHWQKAMLMNHLPSYQPHLFGYFSVLGVHNGGIPWCTVIAPFHHWICGRMNAISCAFITIKRVISAARDQPSLGYSKYTMLMADWDSPPPLPNLFIECYDLLREKAMAAFK